MKKRLLQAILKADCSGWGKSERKQEKIGIWEKWTQHSDCGRGLWIFSVMGIPWRVFELKCDTLFQKAPTERLHFHFSLSCIGEGNGNPLQCSCLENLRDGGAWWAAIYGVAQSRTRLKWLSSSSVSVKYTLDFKDSLKERTQNISLITFRQITCWKVMFWRYWIK